MTGRAPLLLVIACAVTELLLASDARAIPVKEACIAAFDRGQVMRRAGALRSAHTELVACSQITCPAVVRADCAVMLRQVEAMQPTIVLKAADGNGADLTDVSVDLDGQRLVPSLDGRAVTVDPGKLALVFRRGADSTSIDVVVAEGEKSRIVHATLGRASTEAMATSAEDRSAVAPLAPARTVVGWVLPAALAAAGAGALVFGGVSRLSVGSEADELRARCGPTCPSTDRDRLSSDLATTNIAVGIGIAGLALATAAWFIFAPRSPSARARAPGETIQW